jgi:hypothetical protein
MMRKASLVSQVSGIGVLSCEEMDTCNPPDLDMVALSVLQWAGSCRQHLLHIG